MVKIIYIEANGTTHVRDVAPGLSVMQGAVTTKVPGILADCGGACACGTCRVYIDQAWREKTGTPSELEEGTMDLHEDDQPGKRLSCQIKVREELDGLIVRMPERQY